MKLSNKTFLISIKNILNSYIKTFEITNFTNLRLYLLMLQWA